MEDINQNIKNRFDGETGNVDSAFADSLWKDIVPAIEKKPKILWYFWFGALLAGLTTIVMTHEVDKYAVHQELITEEYTDALIGNNTESDPSENEVNKYELVNTNETLIANNESGLNTDNQAILAEEQFEKENTNSDKEALISNDEIRQLNSTTASNSDAKPSEKINEYSEAANVAENRKDVEKSVIKFDHGADINRENSDAQNTDLTFKESDKSVVVQKNEVTETAFNLRVEDMIFITPLIYNKIGNSSLNYELMMPDLVADDPDIKYTLELYAGVNHPQINYSSRSQNDLGDRRNQSLSGEFGSTAGIEFGRWLNDNYKLSSGLEYSNLVSKFTFNDTKITTEFVEDQLIEIIIDGGTGDTLELIYGNAEVTTTETRNVQQYSNHKTLSIPLQIAIEKRRSQFIYGIGAGVSFDLLLGEEGANLSHSQNVGYFTEFSDLSPVRRLNMSLRVSPVIGYEINESWNVILRGHLSAATLKKQQNSDFSSTLINKNLTLGIRKIF